jgi:hypothetical protein
VPTRQPEVIVAPAAERTHASPVSDKDLRGVQAITGYLRLASCRLCGVVRSPATDAGDAAALIAVCGTIGGTVGRQLTDLAAAERSHDAWTEQS